MQFYKPNLYVVIVLYSVSPLHFLYAYVYKFSTQLRLTTVTVFKE